MRRSFLAQPEYDDPLEPAFGWGGLRGCCPRFRLDANKIGRLVPPTGSPMESMMLLLPVIAVNAFFRVLSSSLV